MSSQIQVSQSKVSPSWMPNTNADRPTADRPTPIQSNWWSLVLTRGTRTAARTRPARPTGRLMKKIHSQPNASVSTPPSNGPTRVATPATVPHTPIAAPRFSAGKMRVISAIVCGVMRAAPTPCRPRAAISSPIDDDRPHQRLAAVKTARPSWYIVLGPNLSPRRPVISSGTA